MNYEFKLPDIGEGVAEGEILKWLVSEGESVNEDQPLVEVMTDKVNIEIPSPKSGKIARVLAKVGEVVKVGQSIVVFDLGGEEKDIDEHQNLGRSLAKEDVQSPLTQQSAERISGPLRATPATRKLARELGIAIEKIKGTGPDGRVTDEDIKMVATSLNQAQPASSVTQASRRDGEERVPLKGIRKTIAENMSKSARTAAQVTHVDEADVTNLIQFRNRIKSEKIPKLTFIPIFIKAIIPGLKEFPYMNALFDDDTQEIVLKKYYNIGIATDTEAGLIVPVIREADKKSIPVLASELELLTSKARAGRLNLEDIKDSTFTITSVGSIGGLFSTPLVNYPEVAIIGIQRIIKRPVVRDNAIEIRDTMNLTVSFDHRVIDGAYAARFLNRVITNIENPESISLETLE